MVSGNYWQSFQLHHGLEACIRGGVASRRTLRVSGFHPAEHQSRAQQTGQESGSQPRVVIDSDDKQGFPVSLFGNERSGCERRSACPAAILIRSVGADICGQISPNGGTKKGEIAKVLGLYTSGFACLTDHSGSRPARSVLETVELEQREHEGECNRLVLS